jgi:2-amino-4-hydroxy-6-hydroxymethyldihydropteridine diphosphokinase
LLNERIFVALGGNQGPVLDTLRGAVSAIAAWRSTAVIASSPLYRSQPVDADGGDFINGVIELRSDLSPQDLLDALLSEERRWGRERQQPRPAINPAAVVRHAARPLDLDLLAYGDRQIKTPSLTLPHARMHLRAFVLKPLADLAPDFALINGLTAAEALAQLADRDDVQPWQDTP